ncbi:MAG: ABC transporter permease, partial [Pseudomonadota bacterium]|nr:ABC transporter permease [Pseudomonadota bacterium]
AAGVAVSILQVYVFLAVAAMLGIDLPIRGYVYILPALVLSGLLLGAVGMFISSTVRQLENFAGVMNFVIFPAFFLSSALYPLWQMRETSLVVFRLAQANPFTHAVELIRFALYAKLEPTALCVVLACLVLFWALAIWGYKPSRGLEVVGRRPIEA